MPLSHIEHFLIQTVDLEGTREWYVDVLGMHVGPAPDFKFPVYWLYLGSRDVLHITQGGAGVSENRLAYLGQQSEATEGSGVIDHVGFRCTGLRPMMDHLRAKGVAFTQRQADDQRLYQLFVMDPNGVKVELNFAAEEAAGIEAEIVASQLSE